jgi:predicted nuclease of predicted toxin-antitoxin system
MKVLVDAQLPRRLALAISAQGHDALHTLDLPDANATTDHQINEISEREQRVVITKDADFVNSFLVSGRPYKLLLISTGNIINHELETLFMPQLAKIADAFEEHEYLELNRTALIIHR